jgi:Fur family ferric uptake transcriptional regulator
VIKAPPALDDLLRAAGLRRTSARLAVLEVLATEKQPLSAHQIREHLPAGTDNVTLYRTLNTLTQNHLLHRARGDEQVWLYGLGEAKGKARHGHAHFVCDECGTVECLEDTPVPAGRSGVRRGYRVDYSEVLLHGACPDCHGAAPRQSRAAAR